METVTPGVPPKAEGVLSPQNKAFGRGKILVSFKVARQSALVLPVGTNARTTWLFSFGFICAKVKVMETVLRFRAGFCGGISV
jgi:hypothetical protein